MSAVTRLFPGISSALHWHHEPAAELSTVAEPMPCGMECATCPMAEAVCHAPDPFDVDPEESAAYFAGELPGMWEEADLQGGQTDTEPDDGAAAIARERSACEAEEADRLGRWSAR